jgi:polyisoprenoid-binding protein YceI
MKKKLIASILMISCMALPTLAAEYVIDDKGGHASINFKTKHIGISILSGRFNKFKGTFSYDEKDIESSSLSVYIDTSSLDSNHAERDKHLRSDDFFDVKKYPKATFTSTKFVDKGQGKLAITGDFTMHGITKSLTIDAQKIAEGDDPWGGYRIGFSGTTKLEMGDFDFANDYGSVDLDLNIEGIKQ